MKKFYIMLICCLLILQTSVLSAQTAEKLTISGTVMDEKGEELPGVTIVVKDATSINAVSDEEGRFKLQNIEKGATVIFRFVGFHDYSYVVTESKDKLRIGLKENVSALQEVVVVAHGTQRKVTTTGAVTTVNVQDLQIPATSLSNMLGGRVPGIVAVTRSGEPGNDFSEFWIRGISTFGASSAALILVDGVEGDLNNIDPVDIESFSVLKDASATAVYGIRGANGVVIITTKRGKAGALKISGRASNTFSHSARMPEYLGSYDYARLANEARLSRGLAPQYTSAEVELFKTGLDPDLYPDVSWRDVILNDYARSDQYNVNLSGGGTNARYYMSIGYMGKDGLFSQDNNITKYDANSRYTKLNFRANIDVDLTKTTKLGLNLDDAIVKNNTPGGGQIDTRGLWNALSAITPASVPVRYSNGNVAAYGLTGNQLTPYYLINYTGYNRFSSNVANVKLNLNQDLNSVLNGLTANVLASFTYTANHTALLTKRGAEAFRPGPNGGRANDGSLVTLRSITSVDPFYDQPSVARRQSYVEARFNYNRTFNKHNVTGLIHAYRQQDAASDANYSIASQNVIPVRYQALSARATYGFNDTYLFEANIGLSGSENFQPGDQYGIFPALSAGWVPSNYAWWKERLSVVNFFKLRGSWGKVGNASIRNPADNNRLVRFPYQTIVQQTISDWGLGFLETRVGTKGLKWQTSTKYDVGADVRLFHDKIDLVADVFLTDAQDIYQQRVTLPEEVGAAQSPWLNAGSMKSWGFDGSLAYNQTINKDLRFTLRGNLTFSRNKVTHWEQSGVNFPYQSFTGVPYGVQRGLIALGLFKDEADIASSPTQTFMANYLPGDIKYKDVNNDGIINTDDVVPLKYSNVPRAIYGFATSVTWKKWNFNVFFTGQDQVSYFLGGPGYYPFSGELSGNLLQMVGEESNRWIPASVSGNPATENPNARFPRLSYGANANNNRASTFWLADASFLRLKNAEIAYRFDSDWLKRRVGISTINLSLIGDNLAVWDKLKIWDPEQASENGSVYPMQRTYTLQMNLNF
ncbi:SusC/RagA family TonB-linked outer membrane protein [Paradesertivirga mongoliensis]|uniref:SusC/RagA family TonB-linked outer membrane protein n=1 Tax=Paradesertivirga mongoliensis TaxID=2100740 RepID=A0ABW4ZLN3_9SPHI|nr:TonB-dependent receptor [Pedobacter mongoliensis]